MEPEAAAIAYMVSIRNRCRFCADLHEAVLYGSGLRKVADAIRNHCFEAIANTNLRQAALWAFSGFGLAREGWAAAAEAAHVSNRVANAMGLRAASRLTPRVMRPWMAQRAMGSADWLRQDCDVAPAVVPAQVEQRVRTHVRAWHGEDMGPNRGWVENYLADLSPRERAVARLALLTALASYQVDGMVLAAFRDAIPDNRELAAVVSWAAWLGSRRVIDKAGETVVNAAA